MDPAVINPLQMQQVEREEIAGSAPAARAILRLDIKLRHAPQIQRYVATLRKEITRLHVEIYQLTMKEPARARGEATPANR
jgi:hypothetical protein